MITQSVITCPHCGASKAEAMPTGACQFFYDCTGCGIRIWAQKAKKADADEAQRNAPGYSDSLFSFLTK
jgi:hypothetical protein